MGGVNIVLKLDEADSSSVPSAPITLSLVNVKLGDAYSAVATAAKVRYRIEPYTVVLTAIHRKNGSLIIKG